MAGVLKANTNYLQKLSDIICGKRNSLDYSLARKEVFVSTANLSAAFHRMLSEPRSKQRHSKEIYEFVVLNNVLSSNIAGFIAGISGSEPLCSKDVLQRVKQTIASLEESLQQLDKNYLPQADKIKIYRPAK